MRTPKRSSHVREGAPTAARASPSGGYRSSQGIASMPEAEFRSRQNWRRDGPPTMSAVPPLAWCPMLLGPK
jgi:hypothetical protein